MAPSDPWNKVPLTTSPLSPDWLSVLMVIPLVGSWWVLVGSRDVLDDDVEGRVVRRRHDGAEQRDREAAVGGHGAPMGDQVDVDLAVVPGDGTALMVVTEPEVDAGRPLVHVRVLGHRGHDAEVRTEADLAGPVHVRRGHQVAQQADDL